MKKITPLLALPLALLVVATGCSQLPNVDLGGILGDLGDILVLPGPGEPVVIERPGVVHTVTRSEPYWEISVPVDPGYTYRRAEIDFDMFVGGWHSNLFHGICNLRNDRLLAAVMVRADRSKTVIDRGDGTQDGSRGPWRPGQTYHVHMVYDAAGDRIELQLSQGGRVVQTLNTRSSGRPLSAGRNLTFSFSQQRVVDNAFFPVWGWRFSNLRIAVQP